MPSTDTNTGVGYWDANGTWVGGVAPVATQNVIIDGVVVLNSDATVKSVTDNNMLVMQGGTLNAASGLIVNGQLTGDGTIGATTAVTGDGIITASGGNDAYLEIEGSVDATGPATALNIGAGTELVLDGTVGRSGVSPTVTFEGVGGTLDLTGEGKGASGEAAKFHGIVQNFARGDAIDVAGARGDTVSFDASTDVLTVYNSHGVLQDQIQLAGNYTGSEFSIQNVGGVADVITTTAICFMAGTMIRTPNGEAAVESLKRGDLVMTTDGLAKSITWLGRQTISTVFADPLRAWPVRIKAGAIGESVPARDLVVSPGHAILVDGALILASALVNGSSIVRESSVPKVFTYYHIELDDHSLVLAENTPAETFVDNVDRLAFDNWDEHKALYPNGKTIVELPYPVAKSHRQVPVNIRIKLAERAHLIGASVSDVA